MLKNIARRLDGTLGNVLKFWSGQDLDEGLLDEEKNLYKRGILKEARVFNLCNEDLGNQIVLAEAIGKIGCLAYTGGPPATRTAGQFIPQLCDLLLRKDVKTEVVVATVKCLSIICFNHTEHQNQCFTHGLLQALSEIISHSSEGPLRWAIYCMYNALVGNIRNLRIVLDDIPLHPHLFKAKNMTWQGFQVNYAEVVLLMLGLIKTGEQEKRKFFQGEDE